MSESEVFEEEKRDGEAPETELVVDLEGYEGPIDMLLALARDQKVDLTKISILRLADQYLAFIAQARHLRLEIAADYLVMAAWLAYLKSRLLLPQPSPTDEGPGAEEMAEALAHQLLRLEAMQQAGIRIFARPLLGRDVFLRGAPEGLPRVLIPVYEATLYDLLKAYGESKARKEGGILHIEAPELYSMDDALQRLSRILGRMPDWRVLTSFLPRGMIPGIVQRSAVAATFAASLELVRSGKLQLRQDAAFGPIFLRSPPEAT